MDDKHYSMTQYLLALERYKEATKQTEDHFLDWLDCCPKSKLEIKRGFPVHHLVTDVEKTARKLDMLLSQHWYTLMKVQQIQSKQDERTHIT